MKQKKIGLIITAFLIVVMIMSCTGISFAGSKTKSMTAYSQVYKTGNIAYCCNGYSIYGVNLDTENVWRITEPNISGMSSMKVYKGYIYHTQWTEGCTVYIARVKTNGDAFKYLAGLLESGTYAISNSKIYYKTFSDKESKYKNKVMKLDGKSKKSSNYKAKLKVKKTNASGYYTYNMESKDFDPYEAEGYVTSYLIKPDGKKIELETLYGEDFGW